MTSSGVIALLLASSFQVALSYPPYYDPRMQQQQQETSNNINWHDLAMWSQPPVRPEYEPSYGYPDYGDYGDPRPAYSEMDILREQLARSEPPFNKRLPPPVVEVPSSPWDVAAQGTWYDRELPVVQQAPEIRDIDNEKLQRYTEALMEALAREIEENKSRSRMMAQMEEEEEDEEDGDDDEEEEEEGNDGNDGNGDENDVNDGNSDLVVEELQKAAVKKSSLVAPVTELAPVADADTTPLPTPTGAAIRDVGRDMSAKSSSQGQKEIPLLRPRVQNRRPNVDDVNRGENNDNNNNNKKKKMNDAVTVSATVYRPREAANVKRSRGQLPVRMPRFDLRRQVQPFVAREDDLTQELNSLKKKSH